MSDEQVTEVLPTCPTCGLALLAIGEACPRCLGGVKRSTAVADRVADRVMARDPDDRYEVLATLGRGGGGIVYKVRDLELDEVVALKVLAAENADARSAERFKAELKIARRINHPNVARVYDLFHWRGRLAISQEYIEGRDLDDLLVEGPLSIEIIVSFLRYICSALDAAHETGVVHRDLKPGNIRIDVRGRPHILDFGIAQMVNNIAAEGARERGYVMGTPAFMAPEVAVEPDAVDCRADIYSLGVVLFRMATGTLPFSGSPGELVLAHVNSPPPVPHRVRPDVPVGLSDVILKCLQKDPNKRFARASEVHAKARQALPLALRQHDMGSMPPVTVGDQQRGKVLVIDDEASDRAVLKAYLRLLDAVSVEATDGYRGVESAIREKPDLILLDLRMPVLDGRETLRILKSNPKTAAIPVVILTGVVSEEEELSAKEQGAAFYFNKPINPEILDLLVERYLRPA